MARTYLYLVNHPGEMGAGIRPFFDTVTVSVLSGDPGGDDTGEDSFGEFMRKSLEEWYDGANVQLEDQY